MKTFLKYAIGAVTVLAVFSFFSSRQAQAFNGARNQLPIRLYRGRSNYRGTKQDQKGGFQLTGNSNQQKLNNQALRFNNRSGTRPSGKTFYTRNGIPVNPREQRTIQQILTRQRKERGWT